MSPRELQCLLITGWARNDTPDQHWILLDPDGTAGNWIDATPEETTELNDALTTWPTIATIWQGQMDFNQGHLASCQIRVRNPCTCNLAPPPSTLMTPLFL